VSPGTGRPAAPPLNPAVDDDVFRLLRAHPAFLSLEEEDLARIAASIEIEYYPKGSVISIQDSPPGEYLQIVVSGAARVFMTAADGAEVDIDVRSEGDLIGYLSLFGADRMRANITAIEETVCYLVPREVFSAILDAKSAVAEYFNHSFLSRYMDRAFSDLRMRSQGTDDGEPRLLTTPIGALTTREVVAGPGDLTIREAASIMSRNRVSSLVILDAAGNPAGIVTDRDLREKVAAVARDGGESVAGIMSDKLLRADFRSTCFAALLLMIRHNVHHLLVEHDGRVTGIITNHDLTLLQGNSPLAMAREIESQQHLDGLVATAAKINRLVGMLLRHGAKASNITRIITEINDRLVRRVLELVERQLGPAPLPWCWVVFGSGGRKEQTFKTDQDNAIIFAEPASAEEERRARAWFGPFTLQVRDALVRCGLPACPSDYMASNPRWCQPLSIWEQRFSEWISQPTAEALLNSVIFFDFRPLHGQTRLAAALRDHLDAAVGRTPAFLGFMANLLVQNRPPIGFFQHVVVEKNGEHRDLLNLKFKGVALVVDLLRFFSLEKGVRETATLDRLAALRERHTIVGEFADDIEQAFEFIMLLRIHRQHEQIARGLEPDNFINPKSLTNLEKKTLKEAFQLISRLQDQVIERYRASIM
jgi:CBS domain-containing protein